MDVILRRCEEARVNPTLVSVPDRCYPLADPDGSALARICATFETPNDRYENVCLGLSGRHQITNAATAIALAEALRERAFAIPHQAIVSGLEKAMHPGRLELWEGTPSILFDGAHNPAAARALREYLDEFVHQPVTMIFGAMRDKSLKEMAAILFPAAREVVLTELDNPRAATLADLPAAAPTDFDRTKLHRAKSVEEALPLARQFATANSLILVTGSLYLVGAVQQSHVAVGEAAH